MIPLKPARSSIILLDLLGFSIMAETLNNFCPSKFFQVCPDFHFLKNLDTHIGVQILTSVSRFAFLVNTLEKV